MGTLAQPNRAAVQGVDGTKDRWERAYPFLAFTATFGRRLVRFVSGPQRRPAYGFSSARTVSENGGIELVKRKVLLHGEESLANW